MSVDPRDTPIPSGSGTGILRPSRSDPSHLSMGSRRPRVVTHRDGSDRQGTTVTRLVIVVRRGDGRLANVTRRPSSQRRASVINPPPLPKYVLNYVSIGRGYTTERSRGSWCASGAWEETWEPTCPCAGVQATTGRSEKGRTRNPRREREDVERLKDLPSRTPTR